MIKNKQLLTMPTNINKIKRSCRLCSMNTERHKRYELFVKSEMENYERLDNDGTDSGECQQDAFSNMILYEKVEYCCGIRLAPKSELPSKICGKCFYMIHMWFNFRQMSCNSQIFFSSQTNIKLEDGWMGRNSPELQQMRCELLQNKEKKEEIEFITPDPVNDVDDKDNYSIEKIEVSETDVLFQKDNGTCVDPSEDVDCNGFVREQKNTGPKSNDEEELQDCDPLSSAEEEVDSCNKSQEESSNSNNEEDCLAEICEEEIILNSACNQEVSNFKNSKNKRLSGYDDSLDEDEESGNNEMGPDEDINIALSKEESLTNYFSSKDSLSYVGSVKNVKEKSLCDDEEIDENERLLDEEDNVANVCDNNDDTEFKLGSRNPKEVDGSIFEAIHSTEDNLSTLSDNSDCNEDIQRDINFLLAESERDQLKETNRQCKSENKRVRRKNKDVTRRKSEKSVIHVHDKETTQSECVFTANTECKKLKEPDKYICNICANIHTNYTLFKQHMRTHSKEKPYTCEFCKKGFRSPAFLKCHMPVHTGEKRYKCKYCNLHYTDASSRHRHEKTHTENPKYTCNECGKSFMYKTVLSRHIKLHSGEKLFSCGVCNSSFSLPHHLKTHIKTTTHKEKQKAYEALGFQIVFETRETPQT